MSEVPKLKEEVNIEIRSLLCSSKDGLSENELRREYMNLYGKEIPFVMLGFRSIHQLMQNFSNIEIRPHKSLDLMIYHAKHDEATISLGKLIKGQVDSNKKKRELLRKNEANRQRNRTFNRFDQQFNQRNRSNSANQHRSYNNNEANNNYNLRITSSYGNFKRTVVQTQNVPIQNQSVQNQPIQNQPIQNQPIQNQPIQKNSQNSKTANLKNNGQTSEFFKQNIPSLIKKQIEFIIKTAPDYQLTIRQFEERFIAKYTYMFNSKAFGFDSLRALFESLDDIVYVQLLSNKTDDFRIRLLKCPENSESNEIAKICNSITQKLHLGNNNDDHAKLAKQTSQTRTSSGSAQVGKELQIKIRQLSIKEKEMVDNKSKEFKLNIISVDENHVLVHWSQVADLFNIKPLIFKAIFQLVDDKSNNNDLFIRFKFNQANSLLFDAVQNEFKIDLQEFNEQEEIYFLEIHRLEEYCDMVLTGNAAHRVRMLIKNLS